MKTEKGNIIQITNKDHSWFPCLLIVEEVKSWGVMAVCLIPTSNNENNINMAYNRISNDDFEIVGKAAIIGE